MPLSSQEYKLVTTNCQGNLQNAWGKREPDSLLVEQSCLTKSIEASWISKEKTNKCSHNFLIIPSIWKTNLLLGLKHTNLSSEATTDKSLYTNTIFALVTYFFATTPAQVHPFSFLRCPFLLSEVLAGFPVDVPALVFGWKNNLKQTLTVFVLVFPSRQYLRLQQKPRLSYASGSHSCRRLYRFLLHEATRRSIVTPSG